MAIKKLDFLELKWKERINTMWGSPNDRVYPNLGFGYVRTLAHGTPSVQHLPYFMVRSTQLVSPCEMWNIAGVPTTYWATSGSPTVKRPSDRRWPLGMTPVRNSCAERNDHFGRHLARHAFQPAESYQNDRLYRLDSAYSSDLLVAEDSDKRIEFSTSSPETAAWRAVWLSCSATTGSSSSSSVPQFGFNRCWNGMLMGNLPWKKWI